MNKTVKRMLTMALALVMCLALAAPALADYTPNTSEKVYIDKDLVLPKDATVPTVDFTFTLEANTTADELVTSDGWEIHQGDVTDVVITGTNGVEEAKVSFTPTHPTTAGSEGGDIADATQKYATESLTIDFSGVEFDEPGIYRYKITEVKGTDAGITYDEDTTYYIDLYVYYLDDGTLGIGDIIVTDEDTLEGAEDTTGDGIIDTGDNRPDDPEEKVEAGSGESEEGTDPTPNPDDKIPGDGDDDDGDPDTPKTPSVPNKGNSLADFINYYVPLTLTLEKKVSGNQGSLTDLFDFAIDLNVEDGVYYVTNANADGIEVVGYITISGGTGKFTSASGEKGYAQLKSGDKISIKVPAKGYGYTITEQGAADYTTVVDNTDAASWNETNWTGIKGTATDTKVATGTSLTIDKNVVVENHKNGTVPTGVLLTIAPFVILMVIGVAGAAVVMTKKKYN